MSNNIKENNVIKNIALGIGANLFKQGKEIDEKLENSLKVKFKKIEFDEEKYINSLKFNILLYKVTIRNTEILIGKWIEDNYIPNKEELVKYLERINSKSKQYVNNAIKLGIKTLNEKDFKDFLEYDELEADKIKGKLEGEYKTLSIYSDVLNIFLHKIVSDKEINIDLLPKNSTDAIKELKKYTTMAVNKIRSASSDVQANIKKNSEAEIVEKQVNEELKVNLHKEEKAKLNQLELNYLNKINSLNYEQLSTKMDKEYRVLCSLEEIKYSKGYGFGEDVIKEYAASVVLLDLIDKTNKLIIEGGMRLVINGEFGALNFSDYMDYVITHKTDITIDVWNNINDIVADRYKEIVHHELAKKQIRSSSYIDIEEYIYMIQNADESEKFRKDNINDEVEEIQSIVQEKTKLKSSNRLLKGIVATITVICIALTGLIIYKIKDNKKETTNSIKGDSEVFKNEDYSQDFKDTYFKSDSYIIADSDARYLTEEELSPYTKSELALIRNELFARYGYIFGTEPYKTYFNSKSWYTPNPNIKGNSDELSEVEKANLELIQSMEKAKSGVSKNDKNKENTTTESTYAESENNIEPVSYEYVDYDTDIYYSVYNEAYYDEASAQKQAKKLLDKGIDSTVVQEDEYYKVRVGSDYDLDGAKSISDEMKKLSIDTYILAYDYYVEGNIDKISQLGYNGDYEDFKRSYEDLRSALNGQLGYERYIKQLDAIYEGVTEGA